MSRRIDLPTDAAVESALAELRAHSEKPVTVRALATQLGISNSTFWRCFPTIAQTVADQRRQALRDTPLDPPSPAGRPLQEEARLRAENGVLRGQLELAIANIQRLSLELDQLRALRERTVGVVPIRPNTPG